MKVLFSCCSLWFSKPNCIRSGNAHQRPLLFHHIIMIGYWLWLAGIFFCLSTLMSSFFFYYYLSTEYWRDQLQQQLERRPGFLCPTTHISPCPHPIPGTHQSGQGIKLKQDYTSTHTHSLSLVSLSSILTPLCSRPQMQADLDIWVLSSQGRNFWQTHAHARTRSCVYLHMWAVLCFLSAVSTGEWLTCTVNKR